MTIHSLNGALTLQELGFKRVVLSRELPTSEIEYICNNSNIETECFVHGALCISYSGQCLFSSMIGGRSGNRGKCAQPCRLPYELLENDKKIDSGYLLSTRDLCGLDYIPFFIKAGVTCLKIEGRMKSPAYVATVTRIYRKYIDLAYSSETYKVSSKDREELMQVFNRGGFSCGHLDSSYNQKLIYKEKPNNMGLYLGIVQKYNKNKGIITLKLNEKINIGDTISLENEQGTYNISELMSNGKNIRETQIGETVNIGRMKGNIKPGDKIYKMSSKQLLLSATESYTKENKKISLKAHVKIKKDLPIEITIKPYNKNLEVYKNMNITYRLDDVIPEIAKNRPLDKETIIKQLSKTASTPYEFKTIDIDLDENLFIPKLSLLNELRRNTLLLVENYAVSQINRKLPDNCTQENEKENILDSMREFANNKIDIKKASNTKISILLNILHENIDYSSLQDVDNIYIPLKYFVNKKYEQVLQTLSKKGELSIYLPTILKENYRNLFYTNAKSAVKKYEIKGFVVSNIGNIKLLNSLFTDLDKHFKLTANYTFNIFNSESVLELKKLGISTFTLSYESDKQTLEGLCNYNYLQKELIVYGKAPVLNMNYCLLGNSNKCYPDCKLECTNSKTYYLKDRLNMNFRILPDNIQTVTTVYNSKTTSISPDEFNIDSARIDILDESLSEINNIINTVKSGNRFEGKEFTNGNLNRTI